MTSLITKASFMDYWRAALSAIVGIATYFWGDIGILGWALGLMFLIDYISGVLAAIITKTVNSRVGYVGILKKGLIALTVLGVAIADKVTGAECVIQNGYIAFWIFNEGISVIENAAKCGLKFPKKLIEVLAQLRDSATIKISSVITADTNDEEDNKDND